ncbi:MAG: hypothetical protein ABI367_02010 [Mucilaginibacter sp.]
MEHRKDLSKVQINLNWFTRRGVFYWPVSIMGWFIMILAIAFAIYRFMAIDSQSHSVSDTLINFVFNLLLIGAAYAVIAYFTESKKNDHQ